MKKLYLVDVSSMFFRAFYAVRPLSNAAGMPTNAIYGFVSMTVKLLREIKPDYMAFCFDRPEPSFRKDLDQRYKANRTEMPEELVPQVPYIRKVSHAMGVACFDQKGFEADDIIGSLTKWGIENNLEVVIVSGDKDFAQLVQPQVSLYDTMKDVRYDEAGVLEKWGVDARKMIDYLALIGDSSDNVAGVRGIGPKGAQKLLAEFDSIEDIYANVDKVEGKSTKQKLIDGKDEAFLAKKLVTIVQDVPLEVKPDDLRLKPIVRDELHALLTELDFKSFAKTLLGSSPTSAAPSPSSVGPSTATSAPVAASEAPVANGTSNSGTFVRAASAEMKANVAASLATTANEHRASPATGSSVVSTEAQSEVSASFDPGPLEESRMDLAAIDRWLKPGSTVWGIHTERGVILAQDKKVVEVEGSWDELGQLLSGKHLRWKGFDVKEFWKTVRLKVPVEATNDDEPVVWDQMLAAYIAKASSIDNVGKLFTLYNGVALPELPSPAQLYSAHLRLEMNLRRKLTSVGGEKLLTEFDMPLVPVLYEMELAGIKIDKPALEKESAALAKDIQAIEKEIHHDAGQVFNIGSPKQLGQILFEKLKMPPGKKTKTGYSTDTDVLEKLSPNYPIANKILQYRELSKLKSTYVDAIPALADKETDRVHTTFNQAHTATGRLSSLNPNLQNIPIRTKRGAQIRKAFIAREGYALISADYSQIELRVLAHITSDKGLTRAFESDVDIHTATASEVFDTPIKDVTAEQRRKAKAVNFGLAYGQGTYGLAEALKVSRSEATEIIGRYFSRFSGVRDYMESVVVKAKETGYVETMTGRRRYLDELFSKNAAMRSFGERAAINAPIQGTAADIVKKAMINAYHQIPARMLLQVHDELIFEAKADEVEGLLPKIRKVMEHAIDLSVPLKVNAGAGKSWDDAHS